MQFGQQVFCIWYFVLFRKQFVFEEIEKNKIRGRFVRDYGGRGRVRLEMVKIDLLYLCIRLFKIWGGWGEEEEKEKRGGCLQKGLYGRIFGQCGRNDSEKVGFFMWQEMVLILFYFLNYRSIDRLSEKSLVCYRLKCIVEFYFVKSGFLEFQDGILRILVL